MSNLNSEIEFLDKLVIANTVIFFKRMLEEDSRTVELENRLDRIESKLDLLLSGDRNVSE